MPDDNNTSQIILPIEWHIPDEIQSRYATNVIIQKLENEYRISFFEMLPPIILGDPSETAKKLKQYESIRANCVAQIIIAENKMPGLVKAFQDLLERQLSASDSKAKTKE